MAKGLRLTTTCPGAAGEQNEADPAPPWKDATPECDPLLAACCACTPSDQHGSDHIAVQARQVYLGIRQGWKCHTCASSVASSVVPLMPPKELPNVTTPTPPSNCASPCDPDAACAGADTDADRGTRSHLGNNSCTQPPLIHVSASSCMGSTGSVPR